MINIGKLTLRNCLQGKTKHSSEGTNESESDDSGGGEVTTLCTLSCCRNVYYFEKYFAVL